MSSWPFICEHKIHPTKTIQLDTSWLNKGTGVTSLSLGCARYAHLSHPRSLQWLSWGITIYEYSDNVARHSMHGLGYMHALNSSSRMISDFLKSKCTSETSCYLKGKVRKSNHVMHACHPNEPENLRK